MKAASPWYRQAAKPIDLDAATRAMGRQQHLTKPPGSLGELERLAVRACGWMGDQAEIRHPAVVVFAADHGIAQEGVSAFSQSVTGEMIRNFSAGGAAISVLSRSLGATLEVVQLGTVNDPGPLPGVVRAIIAPETANFLYGPAMTQAQLEQSLWVGWEAVQRTLSQGADILVCGEMGIGNTTSATALSCALLHLSPKNMTGPGTGLDADGIAAKARIVTLALQGLPDQTADPLSMLQALGGFEIAAMVGAYIAAAQSGLPVLVDGFIASVAALVAVRTQPTCAPWMQLSHLSAEPGHAKIQAELAAETHSQPLLDLGMRLGEGTGAMIALSLVRLAVDLHRKMATFEEAEVSANSDGQYL